MTNTNTAGAEYGHYRIKGEDGKMKGGEWATHANAASWARERVRGFWTIVQTDRYGNPV